MAEPGGNIFGLIRGLGITLEEDPALGSVSGQIECVDGAFKISINAFENPRRQKFTAAHELGHFMLHRDLLCKRGNLKRHTDILFSGPGKNEVAPFSQQEEVEANKYAAMLLMPASLVRKYHSELNGSVVELARRFDVSTQAMKIRLSSLGLS